MIEGSKDALRSSGGSWISETVVEFHDCRLYRYDAARIFLFQPYISCGIDVRFISKITSLAGDPIWVNNVYHGHAGEDFLHGGCEGEPEHYFGGYSAFFRRDPESLSIPEGVEVENGVIRIEDGAITFFHGFMLFRPRRGTRTKAVMIDQRDVLRIELQGWGYRDGEILWVNEQESIE